MIDAAQLDPLLHLLHREPGFDRAELDAPPEPLTGGYWATMTLLHLANVESPADTLVLRVMPEATMAAKEAVFQRVLTSQGYPVPTVRLAGGCEAGLGGAFIVMDHVPGHQPLADLDGGAAMRRLPSLARHLPELLGTAAASLHALDPRPLQSALDEADLARTADPVVFVRMLTTIAAALGRDDLVAAGEWLDSREAVDQPPSVCHGDLHPFNLLVDGGSWTLLDWTTGMVADPAYDVTFTRFMLRHPPLAAPAALRPAISAVGAGLARRYVRAYRRARGRLPSSAALDWYAGLHAMRILVEVEQWKAQSDLAAHASHPWMTVGPPAARILSRVTASPVSWLPD